MASLASGNFFVAWTDWKDPFPIGVFGVEIDRLGNAVGEEMEINSRPIGSQVRTAVAAAFRLIPSTIVPIDELGLPSVVHELSRRPRGLVLVTGPTGSGKTTSLAAMLDEINRTRDEHIVTIEDPIEFVHAHRRCVINQRELGSDAQSFGDALKAALRQDPDVILVGEMRDLETISTALTAAETGHLVFATLHTQDTAQTIDRIIDQFPADRQAQIRVMLAESLKGVISQTLCKKIGGGRVAAREVLLSIPAVTNLIREGKTTGLRNTMETGVKEGMCLMDNVVFGLWQEKKISVEVAHILNLRNRSMSTDPSAVKSRNR